MGKRIIARRRGRGGNYGVPSHRFIGDIILPPFEGRGEVAALHHDTGHTCPIAEVHFDVKGRTVKHLMLACEGMEVGRVIEAGEWVPVRMGNILPLAKIPEGTQVFNIEARPGDGGKFIRSGGTYGVVVSRGSKVVVQMPSKRFKAFSPACRACVGIAAGSGRKDKPLAKAGKAYFAMRSRGRKYPRVRGVAMNPVAHPHGGGSHQHVGKPSTVSKNAPPGRKVGRIARRRKRRR